MKTKISGIEFSGPGDIVSQEVVIVTRNGKKLLGATIRVDEGMVLVRNVFGNLIETFPVGQVEKIVVGHLISVSSTNQRWLVQEKNLERLVVALDDCGVRYDPHKEFLKKKKEIGECNEKEVLGVSGDGKKTTEFEDGGRA